ACSWKHGWRLSQHRLGVMNWQASTRKSALSWEWYCSIFVPDVNQRMTLLFTSRWGTLSKIQLPQIWSISEQKRKAQEKLSTFSHAEDHEETRVVGGIRVCQVTE